MKKKIITVLILVSSVAANSQVLVSLIFGDKLNSDGVEFGLEGGWNFSTIDGLETSSRTSNFNLGLYFDLSLQPKSPWSIYTGVLIKANQGVENLTTNDLSFLKVEIRPELGDYKQVLKSFLVPGLLKYSFEDNLYVELGPQFVWNYDAYVEFNSNIDGLEVRTRQDNKDAINGFDMGLVAGFGYQFEKWNNISIGAKYYYGILDIYKSKNGTKSNGLFVKMNVPIGVKKAEKARVEKAARAQQALDNLEENERNETK